LFALTLLEYVDLLVFQRSGFNRSITEFSFTYKFFIYKLVSATQIFPGFLNDVNYRLLFLTLIT